MIYLNNRISISVNRTKVGTGGYVRKQNSLYNSGIAKSVQIIPRHNIRYKTKTWLSFSFDGLSPFLKGTLEKRSFVTLITEKCSTGLLFLLREKSFLLRQKNFT